MECCVAVVREKYRDKGSLAMYSQCNLDEQIIVKLQLVIKKRGEHFIFSSCSKEHAAIDYSGIFTKPHEGSTEGNNVRRVLVEGGAGTGKTALCISVSNGWANGHIFQQFELLLFLPLHQQQIASASSLLELIESLMLEINPQTIASELQQKKGEGVLIVADGWNDLPESKRLEGSFLHSLLFGNTLRYASVMVTSRQTASVPLHMNAFIDRFTEVCGFNEDSIVEYIQSDLANDDEKAEYILEQIHNNPLLQSICSVPLCCTTICHMTKSPSESLPITMTDLCTKIVMKILCHNISKTDASVSITTLPEIDDLPKKLQDLWWRLCKLAFLTIEKSQVNFSQFQSFQYGIELTGVAEFVPDGDNNEVSVSFLHSTFQKYLAAVYVIKQPADIQVNISHTIRFQQLFDFWRYFFGLSSEKEHKLLKQVIYTQAVDNSSKCLLCQCAYEAANSTITNEVIKSLCTKICRKTFIHFGEPHTAHDCEAILYVIANMQGSECDGMIINFNSCYLNAKQIIKLADILGTKSSKLQVKELDLSDNNLPDDCVAKLFATAFPIFHSLEKLFLRNNNIEEKGVCAIMETLLSQTITVLDLSLNHLTQAGLHLIQNAVISGTLTNLKILFMRKTLTKDATFNINFLSTFSEALLSHCLHLRTLDLSDNDFGQPETLTLSSIITRLTTKNINLHLDPKYMSNVDKSCIKAMEDSIKNEEKIDYTIVHGVFVGPGQSGKNSLMNRLMNKDPDDHPSSTGVLEKVVKVVVKKAYTMGAGVTWESLKYDDEALELMMTTTRTNSVSVHSGEMIPLVTTEHQAEYRCAQTIDPSSSVTVKVESKSVEAVYPSRAKKTIEVAKGSLSHHISANDNEPVRISPAFQLTEEPLDIFKRAVKLRRMKALREHLESSWSLYLTNTGGQTKFQELLPLLVCGPSVFFITFPLNQDLDEFYTERYQHKGGREETNESSSTLMDEILQILATIDTLDCIGPPTDVPLKPKVFLVGTFKDKVKVIPPHSCVKDVIEGIDKQLQEKVKKTSLYDQGSIEFADDTGQLIFTVSNLDKDDSDFQKIREALQTAVDRRKEYIIRCRPSWLILSLVLRERYKSHHVLNKEICFTVAKRCGIRDPAEFNKALIFIHSRLGLLRYFDVKRNGLNKFVIINPQILFDSITELLVNTFKGDHATQNEIEKFKKCGLCSMEVIKIVSQKDQFKSKDVCKKDDVVHDFSIEKFVDLLNHLKIAACVTEGGQQYCFFPASLCHAPKPVQMTCLIPPPLLIAFEGGFCPRGIPGALIVYLMNNESTDWKLRTSKVFRNQVSLNTGPCDITLRIFPTHIQVSIDNNKCEASNLSKEKDNCPKIYEHLKQAMESITQERRRCRHHFTFYCILEECKAHPHPAILDEKNRRLECKHMDEGTDIPRGQYYGFWMPQLKHKGSQEDGMKLILDCENKGVPKHLGQIADSMSEWEGSIAEELGLTSANVACIKTKYPNALNLQIREALKRWKLKLGDKATCGNLISAFERAGYQEYAETVRKLEPIVYSHQSNTFSCSISNSASPCSPHKPAVFPTVVDTVLLYQQCETSNGGEKDEIEAKKVLAYGSQNNLAMASQSSCNTPNISATEENVKEQYYGDALPTKESKRADSTPSELTDESITSPNQSFQVFDSSRNNDIEDGDIKRLANKRKRKSKFGKPSSKRWQQAQLSSSGSNKLSQNPLESDRECPNLTSSKSFEKDQIQPSFTASEEAVVSRLEEQYQLSQPATKDSKNESGSVFTSPSVSPHHFSVHVSKNTTDNELLNQPDLTLTTERLEELFASMDYNYVDDLSYFLDLPTSKIAEFQMNYQDPALRKKAYLDYYVYNNPLASWSQVAVTLRSFGLPMEADVVENTYVQVSERTKVNFEVAMAEGTVSVQNGNIMFFGPVGSGKSHSLAALLNEKPPAIRESTVCTTAPVRAVAQFKIGVTGPAQFVRITDDQYSEMVVKSAEQFSLTPMSSASMTTTSQSPSKHNSPYTASPTVLMAEKSSQPASLVYKTTSYERSIGLRKELLCRMQAKSKRSDHLHERCLFNSRDSGGLSMYHEVLPIFATDTTFGIFTVRLDESLNTHSMVTYFKHGLILAKPYRSMFSNKEIFSHCIRAVQSIGNNAMLIFFGTHRDLEHMCPEESREEKNKILLNIIPPEMRSKIIYYGSSFNDLLFPINARYPEDADKKILANLRALMIQELQKLPRVEVPLRYFSLEMLFQRMAKYQGKAVLNFGECFKEAADYCFTRESFQDALQYLHGLKLIFYYADTLPNIIFIDAQILFNKISELVEYCLELQSKEDNQEPIDGSLEMFKTCGIVTTEIMSRFQSGYVAGLFTEKELKKLFKKLFIIAKIKKGKYLMSCLLKPEREPTYSDQFCPPVVPDLYFYFGPNGALLGVYCFLVTSLIKVARWELLTEDSRPVQLSRNRTRFTVPGNNPGCITITDSFSTFFRVRIEFPDNISTEQVNHICRTVCPTIRETILANILTAYRKLNYNDSFPKVAFLCSERRHVDCSPHPAVISNTGYLTCTTHPRSVASQMTDKHKIWLGESIAAFLVRTSDPAKTRELTVMDLCNIQECVWDARTKWYNIGLKLKIDPKMLKVIEESNKDIDNCFRAMLTTWLKTVDPKPTLAALAEALRSPMVGYGYLAEQL